MTQQVLSLDDKNVRRMLRGVDLAATRPARAWAETAQYMRVRTSSMFSRLRAGGTYRGVTWKPFAPQYTRQDGTVVPAWGGIPKVRGRGLVKGRLRPSGQRLRAGDALMQDTMRMRGTAALVMQQTDTRLALGPQGVDYAGRQNAMRPFLFFEVPRDARAIGEIFMRHIMTSAKQGSPTGPAQ